ncbi:hypothetical protein BIV60_22025 [Bacillus sp. MUM 116]|uniref:C39 family peptidase n=1 Tax=Bacillus sp. MUM 116 TaxID=1678002 RepID=UPI0008F57369|nr:C39 family peptidase [Bacillus sp. MUM 116]OIK10194.1 hypothetical protein BIV60_22025 [Bacillus sp. MUM 116]
MKKFLTIFMLTVSFICISYSSASAASQKQPSLHVNRIYKSASLVTGKTAPKAYVSVYRSTGKKVAGITADSKGNFRIPVSGLSGKTVTIYATDNKNKSRTKKVIKLDLSANPANTILLGAPFIDQNKAGAPMGCEGASLLEGLQYQGKALNISLRQVLQKMPIAKDDNPYHGFGGSPFYVLKREVFQSIFPAPLANYGRTYGNTKNISGASSSTLKQYLRKGSPVIVYIVIHWEKPIYHRYNWGVGIDNSHVVLVDGFKKDAYHIVDPNQGKYWVSASKFEKSYNYKKFAVAVQP